MLIVSIQKVKAQTVWEIPEIIVSVDFDHDHDEHNDERLNKVIELCKAFNVRLYDALDGQVCVKRFTIAYRKQNIGHERGVAIISRFSDGQHGHRNGRPNNPEAFHVRLHRDGSELRQQAGTMFMEFAHSYFGCLDEYEDNNHEDAKCPSSSYDREYYDACIMYRTGRYTELCRPGNHNHYTEQGQTRHMSCYEWIAKVTRESGKGEIIIPSSHISGPTNPPNPEFYHYHTQHEINYDSKQQYDKLYFFNDCYYPVDLLIRFKNLNGEWQTKGWYKIAPGKSAYIEDTRNSIVYWYAQDKTGTWSGNNYKSFKGKSYGFKKWEITNDEWGKQTKKLTCD